MRGLHRSETVETVKTVAQQYVEHVARVVCDVHVERMIRMNAVEGLRVGHVAWVVFAVSRISSDKWPQVEKAIGLRSISK